jgi:hypothetical protein
MAKTLRIVACLGVVLCLCACASTPPHGVGGSAVVAPAVGDRRVVARAVVDPALAGGEVYEVRGMTNRYWGRPLSFGGFSTRKTRVDTTWTWTNSFFNGGIGEHVHPYRFVFVGEQADEWQVECRAKTPIVRQSDERGSWHEPVGETELGCAMRDPGGRVHVLVLSGDRFDFRGQSVFDGPPIVIRPLHDAPGGQGRWGRVQAVVGYELRQQGQLLGGVDLLGKGRVYLASGLPNELRSPVAMTATVLLFFGTS